MSRLPALRVNIPTTPGAFPLSEQIAAPMTSVQVSLPQIRPTALEQLRDVLSRGASMAARYRDDLLRQEELEAARQRREEDREWYLAQRERTKQNQLEQSLRNQTRRELVKLYMDVELSPEQRLLRLQDMKKEMSHPVQTDLINDALLKEITAIHDNEQKLAERMQKRLEAQADIERGQAVEASEGRILAAFKDEPNLLLSLPADYDGMLTTIQGLLAHDLGLDELKDIDEDEYRRLSNAIVDKSLSMVQKLATEQRTYRDSLHEANRKEFTEAAIREGITAMASGGGGIDQFVSSYDAYMSLAEADVSTLTPLQRSREREAALTMFTRRVADLPLPLADRIGAAFQLLDHEEWSKYPETRQKLIEEFNNILSTRGPEIIRGMVREMGRSRPITEDDIKSLEIQVFDRFGIDRESLSDDPYGVKNKLERVFQEELNTTLRTRTESHNTGLQVFNALQSGQSVRSSQVNYAGDFFWMARYNNSLFDDAEGLAEFLRDAATVFQSRAEAAGGSFDPNELNQISLFDEEGRWIWNEQNAQVLYAATEAQIDRLSQNPGNALPSVFSEYVTDVFRGDDWNPFEVEYAANIFRAFNARGDSRLKQQLVGKDDRSLYLLTAAQFLMFDPRQEGSREEITSRLAVAERGLSELTRKPGQERFALIDGLVKEKGEAILSALVNHFNSQRKAWGIRTGFLGFNADKFTEENVIDIFGYDQIRQMVYLTGAFSAAYGGDYQKAAAFVTNMMEGHGGRLVELEGSPEFASLVFDPYKHIPSRVADQKEMMIQYYRNEKLTGESLTEWLEQVAPRLPDGSSPDPSRYENKSRIEIYYQVLKDQFDDYARGLMASLPDSHRHLFDWVRAEFPGTHLDKFDPNDLEFVLLPPTRVTNKELLRSPEDGGGAAVFVRFPGYDELIPLISRDGSGLPIVFSQHRVSLPPRFGTRRLDGSVW